MPELPEVETIRRGLEEKLTGKAIAGTEVHFAGSIGFPPAGRFAAGLLGQRFTGTGRRGKYLLLYLDDDTVLVFHLRMTGRLVYARGDCVPASHVHVLFKLDDGNVLYFQDTRKFGRLWWIKRAELASFGGFKALGPEPLSGEFRLLPFSLALDKRSLSVKAFLLDQKAVAGVGNIYADEILYKAGIRPDRPASSLSGGEKEKLYLATVEVLADAIKYRGTTFSDYRDAGGEEGEFRERLKVYQRQGKSCYSCGNIILKTRVAGRGTHYCPFCQR